MPKIAFSWEVERIKISDLFSFFNDRFFMVNAKKQTNDIRKEDFSNILFISPVKL
jgi:hypothetical protein